MIQILYETLRAAMIRSGSKQPPFKLAVGIPFIALAEFSAHEQEHFPGKAIDNQAGVRKFAKRCQSSPAFAASKETLSMDYFIVRERQDEVFVMVIKHRKREIRFDDICDRRHRG